MKNFKNPIVDGLADPNILYHNGVYYLYATSYHTKSHSYEVYSSTDLVNWENRGICLERAWNMDKMFWAPDVKEKDGKFYMLVTICEHLGLAIADSPLGPFIPQDGFLFESSIDGHIWFDGDDMYIYYVSWRKNHKYALYGVKMMPDMITPDLSTEKMLIAAQEEYECHQSPVAEAPYMIKKDGIYYLTYSACHYESPYYCVCYATSDSPLGDFVKYEGNPILVADTKMVSGAGHHCITHTPDGEKMFIIYHTHFSPTQIHPRRLSITDIRFDKNNGKDVLVCGPVDFGIEHPYPLEK
ncbi:MAG: family 43 glycosylhydrolase [Clostridiales bacterium]|nr:family 43 glycosylhydrolase [Clostridiales bacterium]